VNRQSPLRSLVIACIALSFLTGYSPQRAVQAEPATPSTPTPPATFSLRLAEPIRLPSAPVVVLPAQQRDATSVGTWSSYPIYGGEMTSIAMDPVISQTVYVGTRDAGVFKTTDGGASWQPARQGLTVLPIRSLAIDPQHPQILYAGTDFDGVWKSTDGGDSWFRASAGLDMSLIVPQIIVDPLNSQTLYVGMAGGPGLTGGHIFKSMDGGVTWVQKDSGITVSYPPYVNGIRALAIDPAHPLTLYAGTTYAGAFRSQDGGATWTAINDGVPLRSPGSTSYVSVQALALDPHHANRPSAAFSSGYLEGGYYIFDGNTTGSRSAPTAAALADLSRTTLTSTRPIRRSSIVLVVASTRARMAASTGKRRAARCIPRPANSPFIRRRQTRSTRQPTSASIRWAVLRAASSNRAIRGRPGCRWHKA